MSCIVLYFIALSPILHLCFYQYLLNCIVLFHCPFHYLICVYVYIDIGWVALFYISALSPFIIAFILIFVELHCLNLFLLFHSCSYLYLLNGNVYLIALLPISLLILFIFVIYSPLFHLCFYLYLLSCIVLFHWPLSYALHCIKE